jgi:hypothetical protein
MSKIITDEENEDTKVSQTVKHSYDLRPYVLRSTDESSVGSSIGTMLMMLKILVMLMIMMIGGYFHFMFIYVQSSSNKTRRRNTTKIDAGNSVL